MPQDSQPVIGPDGQRYSFPTGTTKQQAIDYFKKKGIGVPPPPAAPQTEGGATRFVHAAGFPASVGEVPSMAMNILLPQQSTTAPGAFQTLPLVGGMFRAQRETYEEALKAAKDKPNADTVGNLILSLLPGIGPTAVAGSKAIESKDFPTAAGSVFNIALQTLGLRRPTLSPSERAIARINLPTHEITNWNEIVDAIDKSVSSDKTLPENLAASRRAVERTAPSVERIATQYKSPTPFPMTVPYRPDQRVRPGTEVTGAPRGRIGRNAALRFGLRPDLAEKVGQRIDEIQTARAEAEAGTRRAERTAQAASRSVGEAAERDIARERGQGEFSRQMVSQVADQVVTELDRQITSAEGARTEFGSQLVRDVAKASWEEYQRVRQPFIEIGAQITQPVTTGDQIRQVVNNAVRDAGGKVEEIPSSAFKAVTKEQPIRIGGAVTGEAFAGDLPESIRAVLTPEELGQGSVSFSDMTRIREDLYGAASASKDTAIKRGLYQAADQITEMQQRAADAAGLGERYKAAKTEYKNFRRGIGSPMMDKFLAAEDAKQQAIIPKLAKLANRATDEALRTVFRSVGIDTSEYDRIGEFIDYTKGKLKTVPKEAAAETKALRAAEEERVAGIKGAMKKQQARIEAAASAEKKEIAKTQNQVIEEARKAGADIVPGYKVEDLEGMSNEQLNRLRLQRMVGKLGVNGYSLYQVIWGLTGLFFHSKVFGAFHLIRGLQENFPAALRSPRFQDYVIKRAGVLPGSPQAFSLRQAFSNLSQAWPSIAREAVKENK